MMSLPEACADMVGALVVFECDDGRRNEILYYYTYNIAVTIEKQRFTLTRRKDTALSD